MLQPTYADLLRPSEKTRALLYDILLVIGASLLVAVSAQINVVLLPVPITGQTFAVLLVGALLGSKRGAAALITCLAEGAAGLPVFAQGRFGLVTIGGPTGGYLIGFVAAAFVVGWLAERGWDRKPLMTAAAMLIGNVVIYAFGLPWLAQFTGYDGVLEAGLYPFLLADAAKLVLAVIILPLGWRFIGERKVEP